MDDLISGAKSVVLYIIPSATIMFSARGLIKIPDELFRKILHFILLGAYIPFLFAFENWWNSIIVAGIIIVLAYPALAFASYIPSFSSFVNERKKGEFKSSMVLALGVMIGSISIGWGILNDKYLVLACIYAWGVGDAFAALIGKRFGKHKFNLKYVDPHKSIEGTLAMFITSMLSVFFILVLRGNLNIFECLFVATISSFASSIVELCTHDGFDTVSCPIVAMIIILPLVSVLGG